MFTAVFLALAAQTLDHSPILMSLQSGGRGLLHKGRGREKLFRFEASWNLQEECSSLIHSSWSAQSSQQGYFLSSVQINLSKCRDSLVAWSKYSLHKQRKSTQSKLNQLSSLQNSNKGSNNVEIKNL